MIIRKLVELRDGGFSTLAQPAAWLRDAFGATPTSSGAVVTEQLALTHGAVYACIRLLADALASLNCNLYRTDASGERRPAKEPLTYILRDLPNPETTAFEFYETLMGHLQCWGNAFAAIERDGSGRVINLWQKRPDWMSVRRDLATGSLIYTYANANGASQKYVNDGVRNQILHVRGLSPDGLIGYSPIRLQRESIGLAMAVDEYGARLFRNQAKPGGILRTDKALGKNASDRIRKSWEDAHQGNANAHRVAVLEDGLSWQAVGINPNDAQFLETRKFQVSEIARIFRVPPHMIADLERATFTNVEQQSLDFVTYSLRPWLVRFEQAIARDVLGEREFYSKFVEFDVNDLLRGDIKTRFDAYAVAKQNGWMSADEIRLRENMNSIPDGTGKEYKVYQPSGGQQKDGNNPDGKNAKTAS
jgi:HK97 family phage portal protein